jgi:hypothetical protein
MNRTEAREKLLFLTKQVEIRDGIWYVEYREL